MSSRHAPSSGTKPFSPPSLCWHAGLWRIGATRCNLWQTLMGKQTDELLPFLVEPLPHLWPHPTLQAFRWWLWQFHRQRSSRSPSFCFSLHSACVIPCSAFKPACFLSVNSGEQLLSSGSRCSTSPVCACRLSELQVFIQRSCLHTPQITTPLSTGHGFSASS